MKPENLPVILAAYLLGSICFGLLIAKSKGVDLRVHGSGNIGAANAGRALGKPLGRLVLLLDMSKGLIAVLLATHFAGQGSWTVALSGFGATLGHCFPIWHGFRGGKGAATAAGAVLGSVPIAGIAALISYLLIKKASNISSIASLTAASVAVIAVSVVHKSQAILYMSYALWLLVVIRHRDNIKRLLVGKELSS